MKGYSVGLMMWAAGVMAGEPVPSMNSQGCVLAGQIYLPGEVVVMNRSVLNKRKQAGEVVGDGEAVLMTCQYLVDPTQVDYPPQAQRHYVWVSVVRD